MMGVREIWSVNGINIVLLEQVPESLSIYSSSVFQEVITMSYPKKQLSRKTYLTESHCIQISEQTQYTLLIHELQLFV